MEGNGNNGVYSSFKINGEEAEINNSQNIGISGLPQTINMWTKFRNFFRKETIMQKPKEIVQEVKDFWSKDATINKIQEKCKKIHEFLYEEIKFK